jgi:nucleoside-diphosphate-sugar epimerase
MERVLVIGGTGASGVPLVEELLELGYDVTVLHGGFHEAEFSQPIRHIHVDVHFREELERAIATEPPFDVVVATYGRLALTCEVFAGRTQRLIAVGALHGASARTDDPRWGFIGRPVSMTEADDLLIEDDSFDWQFGYRMAEAERALFAAHDAGKFQATYIGYPLLYGPRAPGPQDWCVVRRVLDGRPHYAIADGGLKLEMRGYVDNMAHSVVAALTQPEVASGKKFYVADVGQYSLGERIEAICRYMGHEMELVEMPYEFARPCHPLWRFRPGHRVNNTSRSRVELGYRDVVSVDDALKRTVDWLVAHPLEPGGQEEQKIGDPFDYAAEDLLIESWKRQSADVAAVPYSLPRPAHQYRHPESPGDPWQPPSRDWREHEPAASKKGDRDG